MTFRRHQVTKDDFPGPGNSGLRQAGIGQALVSHLGPSQCCRYGMFILSQFQMILPSLISDTTTRKKRGKICFLSIFYWHNLTKIVNYFISEQIKNLSILTKKYFNFNPKNCYPARRDMGWRPRIRENLSWIRIQGLKKAPDPGSLQHWFLLCTFR
jgi:hypothetical protein